MVLSDAALSYEEKENRIAVRISQIRNEVRALRTTKYEAVRKTAGVGNSVTKDTSGGRSKTSDAECTGAGLPHMYTTPSLAQGAYKSGDDDATPAIISSSGIAVDPAGIVIEDGAKVCAIALKQSGKGRKVAYSKAVFQIRPARITAMVNDELALIMEEISKSSP
ncbi:hypothetical protein BO221_04395 [Archangium sp. Cb G35]|nr:hypothetical protein BO221_04395 [Archangium sp. Cb G35]